MRRQRRQRREWKRLARTSLSWSGIDGQWESEKGERKRESGEVCMWDEGENLKELAC